MAVISQAKLSSDEHNWTFRDDKSTLVQVMAWCRQATSHYLTRCWPRSLPPYGVTRPQWVNKQQTTSTKMNLGFDSQISIAIELTSNDISLNKRYYGSINSWCHHTRRNCSSGVLGFHRENVKSLYFQERLLGTKSPKLPTEEIFIQDGRHRH